MLEAYHRHNHFTRSTLRLPFIVCIFHWMKNNTATNTCKHFQPQDAMRVRTSSLPPQHPVWKPYYRSSTGSHVCEERTLGLVGTWEKLAGWAEWKSWCIRSDQYKYSLSSIQLPARNKTGPEMKSVCLESIYSLPNETLSQPSVVTCVKESLLMWLGLMLQMICLGTLFYSLILHNCCTDVGGSG